MKHTPGPWMIDGVKHSKGYTMIRTNTRDCINVAFCDEKNAKLIAAAPDLLEACRKALNEIEILIGYEDNPKPFGNEHPAQYLINAIQKAKGV